MERWIIERRNSDGSLNLSPPQPEKFYGEAAITGITVDRIAQITFRHNKNAVLSGENIPQWPSFIHPQFVARRKTW